MYYDIYFLAHRVGMSPEYIEGVSPAERKIFRAYYMRDLNAKNIEKNKKELANIGLEMSDVM